MFDVGMNEMIVIIIIALIVIGPKQLPEVARMLGRGMGMLRRAQRELSEELRKNVDVQSHISGFRSEFEKSMEGEQKPRVIEKPEEKSSGVVPTEAGPEARQQEVAIKEVTTSDAQLLKDNPSSHEPSAVPTEVHAAPDQMKQADASVPGMPGMNVKGTGEGLHGNG